MLLASRLATGLRNPGYVRREVSRIPVHLARLHHGGSRPNPRGTSIFAHDWDNLVVLDACRFDRFRERNRIEGDLESRMTLGGNTPEFVTANFEGTRHRDLVIVTGNGHYLNHVDGTARELDVHRIHFVEETATPPDASDHGAGRAYVPPDAVTRAAIAAAAEYPEKRLLVHYVQPHDPYLGETADANRENLPRGMDLSRHNLHTPTNLLRGRFPASRAVLAHCYDETLDVAIDAVEDLLENLRGRTAVTADHGEHLGERVPPLGLRFYGHAAGLYTEELTRVPFLVRDGTRRETVAESPSGPVADAEDVSVTARLRDLGYLDGPAKGDPGGEGRVG